MTRIFLEKDYIRIKAYSKAGEDKRSRAKL